MIDIPGIILAGGLSRRMGGGDKGLLMLGKTTIIDAAFLKKKERMKYLSLANDFKVPYIIIHCECDDSIAENRIKIRSAQGIDPSDADISIRRNQKFWVEPLTNEETKYVISYSSGKNISDLINELDDLIKFQ